MDKVINFLTNTKLLESAMKISTCNECSRNVEQFLKATAVLSFRQSTART
jgi:hypothetical protein